MHVKFLLLLLSLMPLQTFSGEISLILDHRLFRLEVASKPREHQRGLSFREEIREDGGMFFQFKSPQMRQFYMYGCLVPIDLIYLDQEGKIIDFYEMKVEYVPKEFLTRYPSSQPTQYAIELKGGTLKKLNLHKGDQLYTPRKE